MSRRTLTGVLSAVVAYTANFAVAYPAGMSRGDFLGAYTSSVVIGQTEYKVPGQATIALGATGITVTNNNVGVSWPAGAPYYISLDVMGAASGWPSSDGKVIMPRVQDWPTVFLNLGSPAALNASGIRVAAAVAAAGPIGNLLLGQLDVPRNVTIQCAGSDAARVFTVTGRDAYGLLMVENIAGAAIGTTAGKKAFASITQISADAATAGNVNVGWGNVLGLPCFVPSAAFISKELQDLVVAGAGTLVVGDQGIPSAVSGDVRGTYVPAVAPDATKGYGLLVCLPEPGYAGQAQFAG